MLRRTARGFGVGVLGLLSALSGAACNGSISGSGGKSLGTGDTGVSGSGNGGGSTSTTGHGGSPSTSGTGSTGGATGAQVDCSAVSPGRAPVRRLTTYEYNNTIRDLLGDTTSPGSALPPQVDSGLSLFGNDADDQVALVAAG